MKTFEPYPFGEIPREIITELSKCLVIQKLFDHTDLDDKQFAGIFANMIGGEHFASPVGIADVAKDKVAWRVRCVKNEAPFSAKFASTFGCRCSPDYSYGITDPHVDVQKTGQAVLNIWNERVNIAQDNYHRVRTSILIRSNDLSKFTLFEEENHRYATNNYVWEVNNNGNLIGRDKATGEHCFTWQPHGSQFTIITKVPETAIKFEVKRPPVMTQESVLENLQFDESWVKIIRK